MSHFIEGRWVDSGAPHFHSTNPATGATLWKGKEADKATVDLAVHAAKKAGKGWRRLSFNDRTAHLEAFGKVLQERQHSLAETISQETGKTLWESKGEIASMINKIAISIDAYKQRCPELSKDVPQGKLSTTHRPHGVMGVLGPYNFPGHLPNGHIVPALLAGNTVVFKPSELAPLVGEQTIRCWEQAGLPAGVINLIQGGKVAGQSLVENADVDGILFTGSWSTGLRLSMAMAKTPDKILALEMGGNNPLVIGNVEDIESAAYLTIQSAFITTGQRCTCARRLIVPAGKGGDAFIRSLVKQSQAIVVGSFEEKPEPFMGPMITAQAAEAMLATEAKLIEKGGIPFLAMAQLPRGKAFITPGIIDVTLISERLDEEYFGPLLQVIRVPSFSKALEEANHTRYGLAAGLLSDSKEEFEQFYQEIKAGVVSWNTPTTGASSNAPFGGIGCSGNNRPSALYAADYCAYPLASITTETLQPPKSVLPGLNLRIGKAAL